MERLCHLNNRGEKKCHGQILAEIYAMITELAVDVAVFVREKGLFPIPARDSGSLQSRWCGRFGSVDDMSDRIRGDSADDGEKAADRVGKSIERGGGSCAKKVDREAGLCNKR